MTKIKKGQSAAAMRAERDKQTIIRHLRLCGIPYDDPTPHQIKVGTWSFYPSTGTILQDNHKSERTKGPDAFIRILTRLYPDHTPDDGLEIIV